MGPHYISTTTGLWCRSGEPFSAGCFIPPSGGRALRKVLGLFAAQIKIIIVTESVVVGDSSYNHTTEFGGSMDIRTIYKSEVDKYQIRNHVQYSRLQHCLLPLQLSCRLSHESSMCMLGRKDSSWKRTRHGLPIIHLKDNAQFNAKMGLNVTC